uniref:FHA domain-containing protein n=1 Tax=Periophthalmus magnuspinnatus TaxID=409849 RepID=A0A3B4AB39_9GOBI
MSVTSWFLVSSSGTRHRLPREMIFVGRDDCELMLQSRSVDKQHAVINYDPKTDEHMVKDLGSLNGTFVNDLRIPDQTYITLKLSDVIRFGYDILLLVNLHFLSLVMCLLYLIALICLCLSLYLSVLFLATTESPISKPTPLYGQPSWWGEDEDPENKKYDLNGSLSDSQAKSIFSYRREPSYFEIPTKELHQRPAKKPESHVHEVPTKDIPDQRENALSTSTPPVVQSHASFTIEFDDCTPGKMKIKDHITKFSFRQQKKFPHAQTAAAPTEVMSAESKVADWLVQSNASMMRRSDSGVPGTNGNDFLPSDLQSRSLISQHQSHSPPERYASPESEEPTSPEPQSFHDHTKTETKQAFVIEFFDDSQRKKRSQSFTNNATPTSVSGLRPEVEKSRKSPSPTGEKAPPTQRYTVPLKGSDSPGPQRVGSLRREKTEEHINTGFSSRSASSVSTRPFSSVGRKSKLARDFTAEFLKQTKQNVSAERKTTSPLNVKAALPVQNPQSPPPSLTANQNDEEDNLSDAGTYTIEADVQDKELEEARSKIDQAFMLSQSRVSADPYDSRTYQASTGNKEDLQTPSIRVHYDMQSTFDIEKSGASRSQDSLLRLSVQDDVEPDSLSDASNSGDGSIIEQRRKPLQDTEEKKLDNPTLQSKSTSFCIDPEENVTHTENTTKTEKKHSGKTFSTATLTKQKAGQEPGKIRPSISAPIFSHSTVGELTEGPGATLLRQESFTMERPSTARLPHISSPESAQSSASQDTHSYLKQTQDVLATLEARLQGGHVESSAGMDSAESDVDTSSSVSQQSSQTKSHSVIKKQSIFHRERSSASITSQDSAVQSSVSDRAEKQRSFKTDTFRKPAALRHSVGKHESTDSRQYSDQESNHTQVSRKYTVPLQKEETKNTKVAQVLSRTNSLSAPRPTRASMLRRARLGESDNEATETDKVSQDAVKQPQEPKKLSRWDMLAMPRKRTGSFNTPSDNEASSGPQGTVRTSPTPSLWSHYAPWPGAKTRRMRTMKGNPTTIGPLTAQKLHGMKKLLQYYSFKSYEVMCYLHGRLSKDLAKDLAILAREIHDVAGDGDSQNTGAESRAPISTLTAHEQLIGHIPKTSLNPQRGPSASAGPAEAVPKLNHQQRQWDENKEEVQVENQLDPLSRIISAIRENTEELSEKIKVLFQDKMDMWEEIETKISADDDMPGLKTPNKDIALILLELRRVQRQLEVMNTVVKPSDQLEVTRASNVSSSSSGVRPSRVVSSQDWRTTPSVSRRGGGPRPGDRVRRVAMASDDGREGYLV